MKLGVGLIAIAVGALFVLPQLLSYSAAQQAASSWSEPVNLGAPINSAFLDTGGVLSPDGLSLYFGSSRPCGNGDTVLDNNIWVARRSSQVTPWEVECLKINVDEYSDSVPDLSADGHWLYFVSDRPGSTGTQADRRDIWVSHRQDVRNDQGWSEPFNLGSPVNTDAAEGGPAYFVARESRYFRQLADQKLIFNSARVRGVFDLFEVNILDGVPFGQARRLDELNTDEFAESGASVSPDGLELFFQRTLSDGSLDLYTSTRQEPDVPWSKPISLGPPINTPASEQVPKRSRDGTLLFFQSNRPGGLGNFDIWVSTREMSRTSAR